MRRAFLVLAAVACAHGPQQATSTTTKPAAVTDPEAACNATHEGKVCVDAGLKYRNARGVPRDLVRAAPYFSAACQAHEPRGCRYQGEILLDTDAHGGEHFLDQACTAGDMAACRILGENHSNTLQNGDTKLSADEGKAKALLQRACDGGDGPACFDLISLLDDSADDAAHTALYQKGCDHGDASSCLALGDALDDGDAKKQPLLDKARRLATTACEEDGDASACEALSTPDGEFYDGTEHPEYAQRACDLGSLETCRDLAQQLSDSDPAKAKAMYQKLCDPKTDLDSCLALGALDETDDPPAALALYAKICDGDQAAGCKAAADLYATGNDKLPSDEAKALPLYQKACGLDDGDSCRTAADLMDRNGDKKGAQGMYEKLCHGKSAGASDCDSAATMAWTGTGKAADAPAVADWVLACQFGNSDCSSAGLAVEETGDVARAISLYEQSCYRGAHPANACYHLELALADAKALPAAKDVAALQPKLDKECAAGKGASCTKLGTLFQYGRAVAGSQSKATDYFMKGCTAKDPEGCFRAGMLKGDKIVLQSGCDGKSAAGCAFYALGLSPQDKAYAPSFDAACKGGFAPACYLATKALDRAAAKKACDAKSALACHFAVDKETDKDAPALHQKACEIDPAVDCGLAGEAAAHATPKDLKKALEILDKGCTAGDLEACAHLGDRLDDKADPGGKRRAAIKQTICDGGDSSCAPVQEEGDDDGEEGGGDDDGAPEDDAPAPHSGDDVTRAPVPVPAGTTHISDADVDQTVKILTDLGAIFANDKGDCDKTAKEVTVYLANNKTTMTRLSALLKGGAGSMTPAQTQRYTKALQGVMAPITQASSACAKNANFVAAMKAFSNP